MYFGDKFETSSHYQAILASLIAKTICTEYYDNGTARMISLLLAGIPLFYGSD